MWLLCASCLIAGSVSGETGHLIMVFIIFSSAPRSLCSSLPQSKACPMQLRKILRRCGTGVWAPNTCRSLLNLTQAPAILACMSSLVFSLREKSRPKIFRPFSLAFIPGSCFARCGIVVIYAVLSGFSSRPASASAGCASSYIFKTCSGVGPTRSRSSAKRRWWIFSAPSGHPSCLSVHPLATGPRIWLSVAMNKSPDSGAPCFVPCCSGIGSSGTFPYNCGRRYVPTNSLATLKATLGWSAWSSRVFRMELWCRRSNAFLRSRRIIVRGRVHS